MFAETRNVTLALLLAGFGSELVALLIVAVFVADPSDAVSATIVIVALAPVASVPSEQVTVDVPLQVPCVELAETNVIFGGSASVTVTLAASLGPAFEAVSVNVTSVPTG